MLEGVPVIMKIFIFSLLPFCGFFAAMVVADTHKEMTERFLMAIKYAIVLLVLWILIFMIDFSKF